MRCSKGRRNDFKLIAILKSAIGSVADLSVAARQARKSCQGRQQTPQLRAEGLVQECKFRVWQSSYKLIQQTLYTSLCLLFILCVFSFGCREHDFKVVGNLYCVQASLTQPVHFVWLVWWLCFVLGHTTLNCAPTPWKRGAGTWFSRTQAGNVFSVIAKHISA